MGSVWGGEWIVVLRSKTALGLKTLLLDLVWITLGGEDGVGSGCGGADTNKGLLDRGTAACVARNRGAVGKELVDGLELDLARFRFEPPEPAGTGTGKTGTGTGFPVPVQEPEPEPVGPVPVPVR